MIYLASPYSSADPAIVQQRFEAATRYVAYYFRLGVPLLSPIVYCHPIARTHSLPGDALFWQFLNEELVMRSSAMWVLKLPGWESSAGVTSEIALARRLDIPLHFKEPLANG